MPRLRSVKTGSSSRSSCSFTNSSVLAAVENDRSPTIAVASGVNPVPVTVTEVVSLAAQKCGVAASTRTKRSRDAVPVVKVDQLSATSAAVSRLRMPGAVAPFHGSSGTR